MNTLHHIAELGCNHQGDLKKAFLMIELAATAGADIVKFQKRDIASMTKDAYNSPHPDPSNAFGPTYGDHRKFLEFEIDQHRQLLEACRENGVQYMSSVWDCVSARQVASLGMELIKIPSACNLNRELIKTVCQEHEGLILVSLGMTTPEETDSIVNLFQQECRNRDLVLLVCTSRYPSASKEAFLGDVAGLSEKYKGVIHSVGYSGHHLGTAIDCGAVALGAQWIERHFTLDTSWKGTDQVFSLMPEEYSSLVKDCRAVYEALHSRPDGIPSFELPSWNKLKKEQIKW